MNLPLEFSLYRMSSPAGSVPLPKILSLASTVTCPVGRFPLLPLPYSSLKFPAASSFQMVAPFAALFAAP
jgi:hypothetical protein